MSLAIVYSRASCGIAAPLITVEVHIARGMPKFFLVGLPEAAVKESRDRVRSALVNSGFVFPRGRITVNLAPADLPKEGGRFDLPIALGILAASEQIPKSALAEMEFTGELALSGEIRAIRGLLPVVLGAHQAAKQLVVPYENAAEAAVVKEARVVSATHLLEVCAFLRCERELPLCQSSAILPASEPMLDLADVQGQTFAKRALEVAAAGKHSLLFIGPPGTGKTMLASRLPGILPELTEQQALEVAAIASTSTMGFQPYRWRKLPFRSPHHTASSAALVGGGRPPKPGEISLAHHGVLFLDELPEYQRVVLESLREPLESGSITISRAAYQTVFPAKFQLITAMNPCPCGSGGGSARSVCRCTDEQIQRYTNKISGPLLDRIDMQVEVPRLTSLQIIQPAQEAVEASSAVQARVIKARNCQLARQQKCNADLAAQELEAYCALGMSEQKFMQTIMTKFNLSARVYHRVVKLARTLADLEGVVMIAVEHLSEALAFRCFDRHGSGYFRSKNDQTDI